VSRPGEPASRAREVILGESILDVSEQLGPLASEVEATAQEVAGGAHFAGIDLGVGEGTGAQEDGDLPGVDFVVLGFRLPPWMAFM